MYFYLTFSQCEFHSAAFHRHFSFAVISLSSSVIVFCSRGTPWQSNWFNPRSTARLAEIIGTHYILQQRPWQLKRRPPVPRVFGHRMHIKRGNSTLLRRERDMALNKSNAEGWKNIHPVNWQSQLRTSFFAFLSVVHFHFKVLLCVVQLPALSIFVATHAFRHLSRHIHFVQNVCELFA